MLAFSAITPTCLSSSLPTSKWTPSACTRTWGASTIVDPSTPQVIRATSGAVGANWGASSLVAEQATAASNKDPKARPRHALTSWTELGTFWEGPGVRTANRLMVGSIGYGGSSLLQPVAR